MVVGMPRARAAATVHRPPEAPHTAPPPLAHRPNLSSRTPVRESCRTRQPPPAAAPPDLHQLMGPRGKERGVGSDGGGSGGGKGGRGRGKRPASSASLVALSTSREKLLPCGGVGVPANQGRKEGRRGHE